MAAEKGTLHTLDTAQSQENAEAPAAAVAETQKDMSKVALIVSLLAVLLLVIFFFGMNRNIAGLTDEVKSLGGLRQDIATLDERMVQMQTEMPAQMKQMLAHDVVNEMAMKAFYLTDTLDDPELRVKMGEVLVGLREVRDGLEK